MIGFGVEGLGLEGKEDPSSPRGMVSRLVCRINPTHEIRMVSRLV
jgi:hypothetical protein